MLCFYRRIDWCTRTLAKQLILNGSIHIDKFEYKPNKRATTTTKLSVFKGFHAMAKICIETLKRNHNTYESWRAKNIIT